jgi:hypothetical protein
MKPNLSSPFAFLSAAHRFPSYGSISSSISCCFPLLYENLHPIAQIVALVLVIIILATARNTLRIIAL